jgi:hypothetical protein
MLTNSPSFSPRTVKNCKSAAPPPLRFRWNSRARREYARLKCGMEAGECWFVTLTRGRCTDFMLRSLVWHTALTRLHQLRPEAQAWTIYEWAPLRGVHLHVVLRGVDGIDPAWLERVVSLVDPHAAVGDFQVVYDRAGLAHYLTKQLADPAITSGWPRHFRPVSMTRGWAPGWLPKKDWAAHVRGSL